MAHLKSSKLNSTLLLFFFFFICVFSKDNHLDDEEVDYMFKLREALTPPPSDWINNTKICQWSGVNCNFDSIEDIDLGSKSLTGKIPSGLDSLRILTTLYLNDNNLTGPIPSLANLSFLQEVNLDNNSFTSIPDGCFQGLTALLSLQLGYNVNLPPWIFPTDLTDAKSLRTLYLQATNLVGSLPDIFDSFPSLENVDLSNNTLSGALPKSLAGPNNKVKYLSLNDQNQKYNKLSGPIEILSSMTHLSQVWLQGNSFEGPIPDLSNCTDLEDLRLQDNKLTGVVPPSLPKLSGLSTVCLEDNFLQGPLPVFKAEVEVSLGVNTTNSFCLNHTGPCDQRVTTLLEIAADFGYPILLARSWRGNDPCKNWSFIVCDHESKIRTVNLTKQNLTGTISPAFGNLTDLWRLYLGGNNLSGSIPKNLTTLSQLEVVDVSNNNLSGNIPSFSPKVKLIATGNVFLGLSQTSKAKPPPPPDSARTVIPVVTSKTSLSPPSIAGLSAASAGVIAILVVVIYNRKRCLNVVHKMMFKKSTFADRNIEEFIKAYDFLAPKRYRYSQVKKMTNSFRDKLGKGAYGTVYKASLTDGRQVAVKVLSETNGSGEEFINEVASISRTSHVNIVSLVGFCYEMNKRALIYEFMPNGSLDKFLHKKGSPNDICNLDWNTLYKIAVGIAQGLEYLHHGCSTRILHLDIKPQNILLDEDFCPKISDFGLAKICQKKESIVSIVGTRGTPGYIAPEVFSRTYGRVSHKSDVYSYGMLILEMVERRKSYDNKRSHTNEMYFPDWIYEDLEQGNIRARHPSITIEENDTIMKIILVSMWCIQPNPSDRPLISKVVEMLEGPLESVPYPPKPVLYSLEEAHLQFSDTSYSNTRETISMTTEENSSIKQNEFI